MARHYEQIYRMSQFVGASDGWFSIMCVMIAMIFRRAFINGKRLQPLIQQAKIKMFWLFSFSKLKIEPNFRFSHPFLGHV